jgi:hypothetical protein
MTRQALLTRPCCPAPQPISDLYLGEYLAALKEEGYSIFVVRG